MSRFNGTHEIGDIVKTNKKNTRKDLEPDKEYKIINIRRGIDGAYDFDDIYLDGVSESVCEFVLSHIRRPRMYLN